MLRFYNSLTGKKEDFVPLDDQRVRMYVCGITVYDLIHLGHARMFIVFDMIVRFLRSQGYDVTYVRNITDIDDKIINRATQNNEPVEALVARMIDELHKDEQSLGLLPPTHEPRATQTMDEILDMVAKLIENGAAYLGDNGDVYYDVSSFDTYGRLSGKKTADLRAGARVEPDQAKKDPLDFVLWKAEKPGEPSWDSPWGRGRPGWHIECSAMSTAILGNVFDIHGGGMDLKFPHHENEIAQTCAATGEQFARYWIHNGFVRIDNEKMSKSLGNFFTVRDVLDIYYAEEIRFMMLGSHYRQPLNYSDKELESARATLDGYYTALSKAKPGGLPESESYSERFIAAMNDDFNTPEALAVLADIRRSVNRCVDDGDTDKAAQLAGLMVELGGILGMFQADPEQWLKRSLRPGGPSNDDEQISDTEIEDLITARNQARQEKNWAESDRIRDELAAMSLQLEDGPDGTTWRRGI